jgi:hypothetical protein
MMELATQDGVETQIRKALCSCFLAVDGTITLRLETLPDAAKAVTSRLVSHGLLESSVDVLSIEKLICTVVRRNAGRAVPVSVPARVLASRICAAMRAQQLAA